VAHTPIGFLSDKEEMELKKAHKESKEKRIADRIKTILLLNKGYSYVEISTILMYDDSTLRSYYELYVSHGIEGLIRFNYKGGTSYLNSDQLQELDEHLQLHTYHRAIEIREYIKQFYDIEYSTDAIRALLIRMRFVYKKPKHVPSKSDEEKQTKWIAEYKELKANKNPEDQIYFIDGVHPQHNSMTAYGWIKKGTEKHLKANTGRERLNLNGALNIEDLQNISIIIREDPVINAQSTIRLFEQIKEQQTNGFIHIICDNARYYRCNLVKEYLTDNPRIKILFLPPYSPNLNIIERLWKFFRKQMLYNKYHENIFSFRQQAFSFFETISTNHKLELSTLLIDNFQIINPNFSESCFL
jgi:transposase